MPDASDERATSQTPSSPEIPLTTPLAKVRGVGEKTVRDLRTLGLTNVGRLIAHLPLRHEYQAAETDIRDLVVGQIVSARGEVTATRVAGRGRKTRVEAVLMDDTGRIELAWFNMPYMRERIRPGERIRVRGKLARYGPSLQIVNPHTELLEESGEPARRDDRLRPVYPANEFITSPRIERAIDLVLDAALPQIEDHLPEDFRKERGLPGLAESYRMLHRPRTEEESAAAHRRLAYDEFLLLQLGVHMKRAHLRRTLKAPALRHNAQIDRHIRDRFPFTLTAGQEDAVRDLIKDLASPTPTNRLIQGDVGSGKTLVALYAMLMAVADRHQAMLMAPTEILAEQHFDSVSSLLSGSKVRVSLLTGATPRAERNTLLSSLRAGAIDILIGTHALLSEGVEFKSLAVAVIDEQHRFGVSQRAVLRERGTGAANAPDASTPHVIVMTATPIPRSLALTLFGDLDISTIRGLPPGRQAIRTKISGFDRRAEVYERVRQRLDKSEQAYIVAPAIEGNSEGSLKDVRSLLAELEGGPLKGLRLAALHGQLKHETRDRIIDRFRRGELDALVATSVIEVGVDVPNATVMVIEQADRFGLAQLHQLRGRVGRGSHASVCFLIADPATDEARSRLEVMENTTDGFTLAEKDLEIRGPGEVFGTRQSGLPPFKVADLVKDLELLRLAQRDAAAWIERSPSLSRLEEALLVRRVRKTHGEALGLADVG